ncbi:MAG: hypothetical protein QCI38_01545 [Candidatus Thermoplasmatota archaeon]|nr:hypothetical protein [Candidatus Thermoplasmatota archaeon]
MRNYMVAMTVVVVAMFALPAMGSADAFFIGEAPSLGLLRERMEQLFSTAKECAEEIREELPGPSIENATAVLERSREERGHVREYLSKPIEEKMADIMGFLGLANGTRNAFREKAEENWTGFRDFFGSQFGRVRQRAEDVREAGVAGSMESATEVAIDAINTSQGMTAENMGTGQNMKDANAFVQRFAEAFRLPLLNMWAESVGSQL